MERRADGTLLATTQSGVPPFQLYRPGCVAEALEALRTGRPPVCFYAGGTDFFAALREGMRPGSVVWLDRMEGRNEARTEGGWLVLGAGLTHAEAVAAPALGAVPGLAEAWGRIATVRIRRHASLGGNLMARRPRYEVSILLSALSAQARLATPEGTREMPVEALWDLVPDVPVLLVSVAIPLSGAPRIDYARDLRPTMTQALCLRNAAAGLPRRRVVTATEYLRPHVADLEDDADAPPLPDGFADALADAAWLRRVASTQLRRQMARLEAA